MDFTTRITLPEGAVLRYVERELNRARRVPLQAKSATATKPGKDDLEAKAVQRPFEIKADSIDEEARTFTGLASTWDMDKGGDVIHQGAFKKTLQEWKSSDRVLPLLDSHNAWGSVRNVIGKIEEAAETDDGLEATFSVIDGPDGDEVWRRIKAGLITGLSIGYRPVKIEMPTEEEEREGVWRHLKEVELREVSVVLWPMNESARIDTDSVKALKASVRALEALADERPLTGDEREELTELHTKIEALLATQVDEDTTPEGEESESEPDPVEPKELAPDDERRAELVRRATETRLRVHRTRVSRT